MYFNLETRDFINLIETQNLTEDIVIEALEQCYKKCAFSTFPYIMHNYNSKEALENLNSGNCVALAMFLKNYLKNKYNVNSFLIPATIPNKYEHEGYLTISHVALAVPIDRKNIYIADPAFYFLNPIKVNISDNNSQIVYSKNVYQEEFNTELRNYNSIERIVAKSQILSKSIQFNEYQSIPKDTIFSICNYKNDVNDKWSYFLREIINPDKAISTFFINIRQYPFITSTSIDNNGVCAPELYITLNKESEIGVSNNGKIKTTVSINKLTDNDINMIDNKLQPYFQGNFKKYLKKYANIPREYVIND